MGLSVDIEKQLGSFRLRVCFEAENQIPLALMGASGCGKSLTLRCIAGLMTPDQGSIILDDRPLFDSAAGINLPPQQRQVGLLFQNYALFPNMTVRQNIAAAMPGRKESDSEITKALQRFQLENAAALRPYQLSGGQKQRAALARLLAAQPRCILLDEPFSALDSFLRAQMELELNEQLSDFDGTLLWVSHDRGEVFRNCRKVCVLEAGQSQSCLSLRELFHAPVTEAAARLSGCENFTDAIPCTGGLFLPSWGITLQTEKELPFSPCRVGIRARHITPALQNGVNCFSCTVIRITQDVFSTIYFLRPLSGTPDAPLLRMELDRSTALQSTEGDVITVSVQGRDLLLL